VQNKLPKPVKLRPAGAQLYGFEYELLKESYGAERRNSLFGFAIFIWVAKKLKSRRYALRVLIRICYTYN
jgi:hypothetical protein